MWDPCFCRMWRFAQSHAHLHFFAHSITFVTPNAILKVVDWFTYFSSSECLCLFTFTYLYTEVWYTCRLHLLKQQLMLGLPSFKSLFISVFLSSLFFILWQHCVNGYKNFKKLECLIFFILNYLVSIDDFNSHVNF